jgi:hypothetical protein
VHYHSRSDRPRGNGVGTTAVCFPAPGRSAGDVSSTPGRRHLLGDKGILIHSTYGDKPRLFRRRSPGGAAVPQSVPRSAEATTNWVRACKGEGGRARGFQWRAMLNGDDGPRRPLRGTGHKVIYDAEDGVHERAGRIGPHAPVSLRVGAVTIRLRRLSHGVGVRTGGRRAAHVGKAAGTSVPADAWPDRSTTECVARLQVGHHSSRWTFADGVLSKTRPVADIVSKDEIRDFGGHWKISEAGNVASSTAAPKNEHIYWTAPGISCSTTSRRGQQVRITRAGAALCAARRPSETRQRMEHTRIIIRAHIESTASGFSCSSTNCGPDWEAK